MQVQRHPRGIGVPVEQIERHRLLAEQIIVHHERPDQIVGTQHVEGHRHLGAFQHASGRAHLLLHGRELLVIDEDLQIAGLRKIHLGRKKCRGLDAIFVFAGCRDIGEGRAQERARDAIADEVGMFLPGCLLDGIERGKDPFAHVVFEAFVRESRIGIDPGNHEYGIAALDSPADERVLGLQVEDIEFVDPRRKDH